MATDSYGRSDTTTVSAYLPASIAFTYDPNGNLTSDGRRGFDYDDENQLVRVTVTNAWKSEFVYDGGQRRRVRKEFLWINSAWLQTNEIRYVYDGKLVIQERDGNNVPQVSYVRGLDLGGGIQTAGGIGGLLARHDNAAQTTAYYHADGSGNVTALVNQKAAIVAQYLYDAFGNLLALKGELAEANLYRFSSKELHPSSGLLYFGYRFYDPNLQRWLNQDPLKEQGGQNLFAFTGNDSINRIDPSGLRWTVARLRSPRALAMSDDPSDTFAGLASATGMDVSDYQTWARTTDLKPQTFKHYSVPNTIMIDYGLDSQASSIGTSIFSVWREYAAKAKTYWDDRFFYVVEADNVSGALIKNHLASMDLYGYIFIGHGPEKGNGEINARDRKPNDVVLPDRYTSYGIAFMELHACASWNYNFFPKGAAYKVTPWQLNVAQGNSLILYDQDVGLLNYKQKIKFAPGVNSMNLFTLPEVRRRVARWQPPVPSVGPSFPPPPPRR